MSYTKHNYKKGDELLASQLNEMDNQIALNEEHTEELSTHLNAIAEFNSSPNIFENVFPISGLINTDGTDMSSDVYMRTEYVPIDSSNSTLYIIRDSQPYLVYIAFYDSNMTPIVPSGESKARLRIFNADITILSTDLPIPENAAFFRLATHATKFQGTLCLSYTRLSEVVEYKATSSISKLSSLYGKNIVFMGDSIIGSFYDSTGICAIIENKTGAIVHNCAFGGTRLAHRPGSNIQYTYWDTFSGVGLSEAIKSSDWTAQEAALPNMTGTPTYFSNRLTYMENIDWSKIDYVIWEYGTNDFSTGVMVTDSSDITNMYAFDNACRKAIENIQSTYSHIQIILVTPLWRWWRNESTNAFIDDSNTHSINDYTGNPMLLTAFVTKVQEIAKEYQLPCIDNYYTMGANKFTYLHYYDETDGVHPNKEGRKRIAEHIISQLDSVV